MEEEEIKSALDRVFGQEEQQEEVDFEKWTEQILNETDANKKIAEWNRFRKKLSESNQMIDINLFNKLIEDEVISQQISMITDN